VPTPVEDKIERALGEVLPPREVSRATRQVLRAIATERVFQGPVPPPEYFRGYEEVLPGAADRILRMAEREQEHRIMWEQEALRAEARNSVLGMKFGFGALIILILGAMGAAFLEMQPLALALTGTVLVGVVTSFIQGRNLFGWLSGRGNVQEEPSTEAPSRNPPQR
jgi:uncharacterized membrane protein